MSMCFATVASKEVLPEFRLLKKSIELFCPGAPLVVSWHGEVTEDLTPVLKRWLVNEGGFELKRVGADKARVIRHFLLPHEIGGKLWQEFDQVMYVDCDVLFLGD